MRRLLYCALAIGLALPVAEAQAATPPSAGDSIAALAAARDLLIASGFENQMQQAGVSMANMAFEQGVESEEAKQGKAMPEELKQRIKTVMSEEIGGMLKDMKHSALENAAQIYAQYFSAEELRRLAVLNQDPVMRKAQSLLPQMMPQLAQIGMKAAQQRKPQIEQRVKATIEEWASKQKTKGTSL